MAKALYPGSFDPVHNGHVAVIETATSIFDEVIVAVGHNPEKSSSGFLPAAERVALIEQATDGLTGVRVVLFSGLVTAAAADHDATCLLKGLRSSTDLDVEMLQAKMNSATGGGLPTVFVPGIGTNALVSSRYVREIAAAGGDVSSVVPAGVASRLSS
jgi:pantetheine-phosphate adenylyltransferase